MARYSKIFFVFIILVLSLLAHSLVYHFMTAQPIRNPFTLYSCIIDDFACLDYSENKGVQYKDRNGHLYSDRQFDSILPFFYYHQLAFRRPPAGQPERNKTNSAKNRIDQFHFQTIRFGHK